MKAFSKCPTHFLPYKILLKAVDVICRLWALIGGHIVNVARMLVYVVNLPYHYA